MSLTITRTSKCLTIVLGDVAKIDIFYSAPSTYYKIHYLGEFERDGKIVRPCGFNSTFHNKVLSFFTRNDVIKAFPLNQTLISRDIKLYCYGNVNGYFVGNGGVYYAEDGKAYKLITHANTKMSWYNNQPAYLQLMPGVIINNPQGLTNVPTYITDKSPIYLALLKAIDDKKTVAFALNNNHHVVMALRVINGCYIFDLDGFGSLMFTKEQLEAQKVNFVTIEEVKTVTVKKLEI